MKVTSIGHEGSSSLRWDKCADTQGTTPSQLY
jgi:hypothetical protein